MSCSPSASRSGRRRNGPVRACTGKQRRNSAQCKQWNRAGYTRRQPLYACHISNRPQPSPLSHTCPSRHVSPCGLPVCHHTLCCTAGQDAAGCSFESPAMVVLCNQHISRKKFYHISTALSAYVYTTVSQLRGVFSPPVAYVLFCAVASHRAYAMYPALAHRP